MKECLHKATEYAETLDEVFDRIIAVFRAFDPGGPSRKFWSVSGVITSHGDVAENLVRMANRAEAIKQLSGESVFAPTCVFSAALVEKLQANRRYRHEDWMVFWIRVIRSGYVGAVVVTPLWERSRGADTEYAIARNLGLAIYYYDDVDLFALE